MASHIRPNILNFIISVFELRIPLDTSDGFFDTPLTGRQPRQNNSDRHLFCLTTTRIQHKNSSTQKVHKCISLWIMKVCVFQNKNIKLNLVFLNFESILGTQVSIWHLICDMFVSDTWHVILLEIPGTYHYIHITYALYFKNSESEIFWQRWEEKKKLLHSEEKLLHNEEKFCRVEKSFALSLAVTRELQGGCFLKASSWWI